MQTSSHYICSIVYSSSKYRCMMNYKVMILLWLISIRVSFFLIELLMLNEQNQTKESNGNWFGSVWLS